MERWLRNKGVYGAGGNVKEGEILRDGLDFPNYFLFLKFFVSSPSVYNIKKTVKD